MFYEFSGDPQERLRALATRTLATAANGSSTWFPTLVLRGDGFGRWPYGRSATATHWPTANQNFPTPLGGKTREVAALPDVGTIVVQRKRALPFN